MLLQRKSSNHIICKCKEKYDEDTNADGARFTYAEILEKDKTSLDITWIKNKSLTDLDNLPDPEVLAEEIIENLQSGIESFK